jgi:hypothetical protein
VFNALEMMPMSCAIALKEWSSDDDRQLLVASKRGLAACCSQWMKQRLYPFCPPQAKGNALDGRPNLTDKEIMQAVVKRETSREDIGEGSPDASASKFHIAAALHDRVQLYIVSLVFEGKSNISLLVIQLIFCKAKSVKGYLWRGCNIPLVSLTSESCASYLHEL